MTYEIQGGAFPVVKCELRNDEAMITEKGAMVWMTSNIKMETKTGIIAKAFSRVVSGEKMFQNIYTAQGNGMITFGSNFPGEILPLTIDENHEYIVQKRAFLASEKGVKLSVFLNKKLGTGFFGGEGFIMQKLSGYGTAFVEVDGGLVEHVLKEEEQLIVDTGHVAGFTTTVQMDIHKVPGVKNVLFGGEGIFNTVLTGPGRVWLQTMPISNLAAMLKVFAPKGNS